MTNAPSLLEKATRVRTLMKRAYDSDALREFIATPGLKARSGDELTQEAQYSGHL